MVDLLLRSGAADGELRVEENLVAHGVVFDVHRGEGGVGDAHDRAVEGADAGGTKADVFDGAEDAAEVAVVADHNRSVADHGNAPEQVGQCLLGGEGNGDPAHAKAGNDSGHVEAPIIENRNGGEDGDHRFESAAAKIDHRVGNGAAVRGQAGFEPDDEVVEQVDDSPGNGADDEKQQGAANVKPGEGGGGHQSFEDTEKRENEQDENRRKDRGQPGDGLRAGFSRFMEVCTERGFQPVKEAEGQAE